MMKSSPADPLRAAVIEAYRGELKHRYSSENVRRFSQFEHLDQKLIDDIRNFFLEYIYPPYAKRGARDNSFEEMGNVLKSPRKLLPLFGTALTSVWKLGGHLGQAMKAGFRTLETYIESKRLEEQMIQLAQERGLEAEHVADRESITTLVRGIPEKKVRRFQKDMVRLFESLANVELLERTLEIMADSRKIMEERPDVYTDSERAGLGYGYELLEGGFELFREMNDQEVEAVLSGVEVVEKDWYKQVMQRT